MSARLVSAQLLLKQLVPSRDMQISTALAVGISGNGSVVQNIEQGTVLSILQVIGLFTQLDNSVALDIAKLGASVNPYVILYVQMVELAGILVYAIVNLAGLDPSVLFLNVILAVQPMAENVLAHSSAAVQQDGLVLTALQSVVAINMDQTVVALAHVTMVPPVTLSLENATAQQDGQESVVIQDVHQEAME
jgi:hypothetical protein